MEGHRAPSLHGDTPSDDSEDTVAHDGQANAMGRSLLALGIALSDGRIQIVALAPGHPPHIAGMVTIDEISSDIRLELQLNELLQSLPGHSQGVPIGLGYQATTEHDERNFEWTNKAMLRLETPVERVAPLAKCIAHVQLGGNPHPLTHGAIGAALLAVEPVRPAQRTIKAEAPQLDQSDLDKLSPQPPADDEPETVVSTKLIERLLLRVDELEETIRNTGPIEVVEQDRPVAPQDSLDRHIDQLANAPESAVSDSPDNEDPADPQLRPADLVEPEPTVEAQVEEVELQLAQERAAARDAALQLERLATQLDTRLAEATEHSDQVRQLTSVVDETKSQLRSESRLAHDQRVRIADLEAEIVRLGENLSTARDERRRTEQRFAIVSARNKKLEAQADVLAESQVEVYRLNARISILEDKLDNERRRTRNAQERASRLRHDMLSTTPRPLNDPRSRASKRVG